MRPHVVADVGNSRVKWGLCAPDGSRVVEPVSLADDPAAWREQLALWAPRLAGGRPPLWVLASVRPERSERLRDWLLGQGSRVAVLSRADQLPLTVALERPDHVGIDRLLDAVAAKSRLPAGRPAVLVDAGSAVTVDWLDEAHVFRGGSIFPGLRLMAEALHAYTALLPLVTVTEPVPPLPGSDTRRAMQAGIFHAVAGGIERIARQLTVQSAVGPQVFLTGGEAGLLHAALGMPAVLWPEQTLEGILHSAEALPDDAAG
jgi:type III pantothenate kinase